MIRFFSMHVFRCIFPVCTLYTTCVQYMWKAGEGADARGLTLQGVVAHCVGAGY